MAALVPVLVGGNMVMMTAARALEALRMGYARALPPGMRVVGSQSAGANPSGPFYGGFSPNMPSLLSRPELLGRGLAGGAALVSALNDGPGSFQNVRDSLFNELSARGTAAPPPVSAAPPSVSAPPPMRAADLDGPSTYSPDYSGLGGGADSPREIMMQRALSATAAPAKAAVARSVRVPLPPPRPREEPPPRSQEPPRRIDYQSMNALAEGPERGYTAPVVQDGRVNWGDPDNPADFFRADQAMMRMMREGRAEGGGIPEGMMGSRPMPMPRLDDLPPMPAPKPAGGGSGGAGGTSAAINKALEIIHHLVIRGR